MKPLIPILVVATTSLAVASVQYARQASTQRERADAEAALRQKQEARVAQLERDHARLERELEAVRAEAAEAAKAPPVARVTPPPAPAPKASVRGGGQGDGVWTVINQHDPNAPSQPRGFVRGGPAFMETEAGRNYMKSRAKMAMRRLHQDMGSALGLSQEKEGQLLDLLADQQSRVNERFRSAGNADPTKPFDFREVQNRNNAEIAALIGQDKMDDWAAYQQSLPDRSQVNMVNQQLTEAGAPGMTENQRAQMLTAVTEERQIRPRPTMVPGLTPEEQFAQSNEWQAEYDKAVLDRARSILSSEQYEAYKEFQEFQSEMRKSIPRFSGAPGAPVIRFNSVGGEAAGALMAAPMVDAVVLPAAPPLPAPRQ